MSPMKALISGSSVRPARLASMRDDSLSVELLAGLSGRSRCGVRVSEAATMRRLFSIGEGLITTRNEEVVRHGEQHCNPALLLPFYPNGARTLVQHPSQFQPLTTALSQWSRSRSCR